MVQYRDDLDAARRRIETLEAKIEEREAALRARDAELSETRAELERVRGSGGTAIPGRSSGPGASGRAMATALLVGIGVVGAAGFMSSTRRHRMFEQRLDAERYSRLLAEKEALEAERHRLLAEMAAMERRRQTAPPTTEQPATVIEAIHRSSRKARACYEEELRRNPGAQAEITVVVTVEPSGKVSNARVEDRGPDGLTSCLVKVTSGLDLGRQVGAAGPMEYRIPYVFGAR